jgi:hypothetical protein
MPRQCRDRWPFTFELPAGLINPDRYVARNLSKRSRIEGELVCCRSGRGLRPTALFLFRGWDAQHVPALSLLLNMLICCPM